MSCMQSILLASGVRGKFALPEESGSRRVSSDCSTSLIDHQLQFFLNLGKNTFIVILVILCVCHTYSFIRLSAASMRTSEEL